MGAWGFIYLWDLPSWEVYERIQATIVDFSDNDHVVRELI
jgi:hypothetical protein